MVWVDLSSHIHGCRFARIWWLLRPLVVVFSWTEGRGLRALLVAYLQLEQGHQSVVRCMSYLPSSIVTGGEDARLCMWPASPPAPQPVAAKSHASAGGGAVASANASAVSGGGVGVGIGVGQPGYGRIKGPTKAPKPYRPY